MTAPSPVSQWISAKTVADSCNVSSKTIWKWRRDPKIRFPAPRVINGRLYFDLGAVELWKSSNEEAPE